VSGPETAAFVIPQVMMWYARFIQAISFLVVVLFFFYSRLHQKETEKLDMYFYTACLLTCFY